MGGMGGMGGMGAVGLCCSVILVLAASAAAENITEYEKVQGVCQRKWYHFGTKCYRFYTSCRNLNQAQKSCKKADGEVGLPESQVESDYMDQLAPGRRSHYLLNMEFRTGRREFRRQDRTKAKWQNWRRPDTFNVERAEQRKKQCVMQRRTSQGIGYWYPITCKHVLPYFCVKDAPSD